MATDLIQIPPGPYYVWVDGDCPDKTDDYRQACQWAHEFRQAGKDDVYIVDADNNLVSED